MIKALAVTALTLTLASGAADSGCKDSPPPKHAPGKHRVTAAPNPDPAPTNKRFPGNVSLTFWLDQDHGKKTVSAYNVGAGYQNHYCTASCHWSVTAKPNQLVTVTTDYYTLGATGWLKIQVIQNNNGRILCHDDNSDTGRKGGVSCSGTVVI